MQIRSVTPGAQRCVGTTRCVPSAEGSGDSETFGRASPEVLAPFVVIDPSAGNGTFTSSTPSVFALGDVAAASMEELAPDRTGRVALFSRV